MARVKDCDCQCIPDIPPPPPPCGDCLPGNDVVSLGNPSWYDYALFVCNVNSAKDDVFNIILNGFNFGSAPELGVDACGGRMFVTNLAIVGYIKGWYGSPCTAAGGDPTFCCTANPFTVRTVAKAPFLQANWVVQMMNIQNNANGNFGDVLIWKLRTRRFLFDGSIIVPDPCLFNWGATYSGVSGVNITVDFAARIGFNPQTLIP